MLNLLEWGKAYESLGYCSLSLQIIHQELSVINQLQSADEIHCQHFPEVIWTPLLQFWRDLCMN